MTTKDEAITKAANEIAMLANECCYRSDGWEEDIATAAENIIRAALAQPEPERNFCALCGKRCSPDPCHIHTCTPPAEQLTQEPVAWLERGAKSGEWFLAYFHNPETETKPLYTSPQPAQKPLVEWVSVEDKLPIPGRWLVTVDIDNGDEVHILELNQKNQWLYENDPVFCLGYSFCPSHWAPIPEPACSIKEQT